MERNYSGRVGWQTDFFHHKQFGDTGFMTGLKMSDEKRDGPVDGVIDSDIQEKLGEKLKEAYSDVINEPVPDRFLDLLNQLSKQDAPSDERDSDE